MSHTSQWPHLCMIRSDADMPGANSGADAFVRSAESVDSTQRLLWIESLTAQTVAKPGSHEISTFALARDVGDGGAVAPSFLYLVQTDIPDDIVAEYTQWYDVEHLPRLVSVPGILRARRYEAVDAKPRYLTAYDLSDVDAFESPQGLIARKTPWTERMRSKFMNARRSTWRVTHSSQ